jgi:Per1-like family
MTRDAAALLFFSCLLLPSTLASSGDRAAVFQACVSRCEQEICYPPKGPVSLPLALRLTQWTCTGECQYTCMHAITDHAVSTRDYVHQYYGKWPFWRFAGMQEPASVLFSVLNLCAHLQGLRTANRVIPSSHPIKIFYVGWGVVNVNAWVWSAVFHTRGTVTRFQSESQEIDHPGRYSSNRKIRLFLRRASNSLFIILHHRSSLPLVRPTTTSGHISFLNPKIPFTNFMGCDLSTGLYLPCLLPDSPPSV